MNKGERPLRWGILGVAKILRRLGPAFQAAPSANVRAIASRSLDRSRVAARDLGAEVAYGCYEELLADQEVDAVYIPLPNSLHAEWIRAAADRGKHVLCEKPLCPTAAEAAAVVAYCRERGIRLMEGFMWPHHPRTRRIRQAIDDGTIGEVRRVAGALTFRMDPLDPANIRLRPDLAGGSLLDVGCYPISGIRWAMGAEPVHVFARGRHMNGVDIEASGQLFFDDDRVASFDCGFTLPYRAWLEIVGTNGTIRVPRMWAPQPRATWEVEVNGQPAVEHVIEGEDQIVRMLDEFAAAVRENRDPRPGPDEAVKSVQVLDALRRSIAEGREIKV
ncbi:MAG TPA: Gfo/Idh/MocA family oxidoreductase [Gemmataceae bacterium]|jgi:predicted dehydrogenase|nr:Gfo/Idh/MocA family oxidoreductase [Gemmataceae bacterium]